MAERIKTNCQTPHPDWKTVYYSGYSSMKDLYCDKSLESLMDTSQLTSDRFVMELSMLNESFTINRAAIAAGHLHYLYERMLEKQEEKLKNKPASSKDTSDPRFDFVVTKTYLAWRLLEVYLTIMHFHLSEEKMETAKSLEETLSCTYDLINQNQELLPTDYRLAQDHLHDTVRGRVRNALYGPNYSLDIPYFRSQKRAR